MSYQLKVDEDRKFSFGARIGYQEIGFLNIANLQQYKIPTMAYRRGFNSSAGLIYRGPGMYWGFSVDNIVRTKQIKDLGAMKRQCNMIIGMTLGRNRKVSTDHSIYWMWMDRNRFVDLNNTIVIRKTAIVGFTLGIVDNDLLPKFNAGLQLKNLGRLVVMVYSKTNDLDWKKFSGQIFLQVNIRSPNEPS